MQMTTNMATMPARPWYTYRWPWFLMLGPATVLVGGAYVTTLALRHPDAMVVDDYYKQGKAINQDLRRDRVASRLRLAVQASYDPRAGRLRGRITSAGQAYAKPFLLRFAHPTLPERDVMLMVKPDDDGRFTAALPALEATHWEVVAEGALRDWKLGHSWDWSKQPELGLRADGVAQPGIL